MSNSFLSSVMRPENRTIFLPVIVGVVVFAMGIWWLLRTDYISLDAPLTDLTRPEALATLQNAGIDYRTNSDGAVEVADKQLPQARALLTQLGLAFPEPTGFELLDKTEYTLSDFSQRLNYQRALEGELARTVMGLREVRSARVHLSIPKQELFSAVKNACKASVTLQLKPGQSLSDESAEGIREIIASSVDGLKPENVTIIDDQGTPLKGGVVGAGFDQQHKLSRQLEVDLERRVRQLLQETWGISNPYVSVRADLNFDRVTAVRDGAVPTAESVGLLTHEETADAPPTRDGLAGTSTSTREYVYTREHIETEFASGGIARLSIAVALPAGFETLDLPTLEKIVGAAIGLQTERGDKLVVSFAPALVAAAAVLPPSSAAVGEATDANPQQEPPVSASPDNMPADANSTVQNGLIAALLLALATAFYFALRSNKPRAAERMTQAHREQLLADLQKWVKG